MKDRVLTLDFGRDEQRLKVAFFEGEETTLRPYEIHEPNWRQIEEGCREILSTLNRSNRNAKTTPDTLDGLRKSGHLLFDLLLPLKAKERLANTTARILTLRLDDTLVHIPWELLYDGREFLCRRFATGRIASTRQVPTARSIRAPLAPFKVLILADPRGDLQASYREGMDLKAFLDARRDLFHVDFKSYPVDIAFVKKHLRDYDIVHYAGHAKYTPENSSQNGWLLSDGILAAPEIAALGGLQPMPALVFSNACQSGQTEAWKLDDGQSEQTFGLAYAFLLSGVKHYIGTFRDLGDEPSFHFAKPFYTSIARGEAIGTAIRNARDAMVGNDGEKGLAWANYMLYGDPGRELGDREKQYARRQERQGWKRLVLGRALGPRAKDSIRNSPLYFSLIGVLLLASLYTGYSVFYAANSKEKASSSLPVVPSALNLTPASSPKIKAPLSLSMNLIGQRKEADGSYSEVIVQEGSVLRSGDGFQVHVQSSRHSHVYILLYDSQGRASQLFPDPKIEHSGYMKEDHKLVIPDKDLWFWLDDKTGTETIYVLAAEEPLRNIKDLLMRMETVTKSALEFTLIQRGVEGIGRTKAGNYVLSYNKLIQNVTDILVDSGAVVKAISFRHG